MKYDFLIIGSSGMQGRIATKDLLEKGFKVYCADLYREGSEDNLSQHPGTPFSYIDLRDHVGVKKFIHKISAPIVINCAEGDWNIDVFKACLEEKRHVIDLGSDIPMTKAQLAMDKEFKANDLTAITGCGSTPGINNVMMKHASQFFSEVDTIEVGFAWDSNIKKFVVPFSMESIIEEMTDPAPIVEDGKWIEKKPMDTEIMRQFREIGVQKCYLVRHPETFTFFSDYKNLKPKNIRFYAGFPDHTLEVINRLIDLGLGEKDLLTFEKIEIRPVDALSRILTRLKRPDQYMEKENLWVEVSGTGKDGHILMVKMECIVSTIPSWIDAGCNIDTAFPASIIARMILDKRITDRGSFAPDAVVPPVDFFHELRKCGIIVFKDGIALNGQSNESVDVKVIP